MDHVNECLECGAEFVVHLEFDTAESDEISFCPFCGSELYELDEFEDKDEDDES